MSDIDDATLCRSSRWKRRAAGFLSDRRRKILFERHVFSRLTERDSTPIIPTSARRLRRSRPLAGAHQYSRLEEAAEPRRERRP